MGQIQFVPYIFCPIISPSKIKAIEILKEGTKAIQERGLKEDGRSYIIVTLEK